MKNLRKNILTADVLKALGQGQTVPQELSTLLKSIRRLDGSRLDELAPVPDGVKLPKNAPRTTVNACFVCPWTQLPRVAQVRVDSFGCVSARNYLAALASCVPSHVSMPSLLSM